MPETRRRGRATRPLVVRSGPTWRPPNYRQRSYLWRPPAPGPHVSQWKRPFFNPRVRGARPLIHFLHLWPPPAPSCFLADDNRNPRHGVLRQWLQKWQGEVHPRRFILLRSSPPPSLTPARTARQRLHIPVQQARWRWEFRQQLSYPDVMIPHDCISIRGGSRCRRAAVAADTRRRGA